MELSLPDVAGGSQPYVGPGCGVWLIITIPSRLSSEKNQGMNQEAQSSTLQAPLPPALGRPTYTGTELGGERDPGVKT